MSIGRSGFWHPIYAEPSVLAIGPVEHLRDREIRVFEAAHRHRARALEGLCTHEDDRPAHRAEALFQPFSRLPHSAPGSRLPLLADDRRVWVNRPIGEGGAGATLTFQTGTCINTPRLSGKDQLYLTAGATGLAQFFRTRHSSRPLLHGMSRHGGTMRAARQNRRPRR